MFHSCYSAAQARELSVHGRLVCTFPKQAIRNATTGGWAIDPNASEWTAYWDLMMMALLTVVLFLTPYEVAFLAPSVGVLFIINRVLDLVFFCDMVIQFFLAYQNGPEQGSTWVKSLPMIRKRYMKGWFTVDLFSTIPIDTIAGAILNMDSSGGQSADDLKTQLRTFKLIRGLRLLRLLKLVRLFKLKKLAAVLEDNDFFHPAMMQVFSLLFKIVFVAHMLACFWYLVGSPESNENPHDGWVTVFGLQDEPNGVKYRYVYKSPAYFREIRVLCPSHMFYIFFGFCE